MNKRYLLLNLLGITSLVSCGCSSIWRPELEEFIFKTHFSDAALWCEKALLTADLKTVDTKGEILESESAKFYFESTKDKPLYYHLVEKLTGENVTYTYLNRRYYKDTNEKYQSYEKKDNSVVQNETNEDFIINKIEKFFFSSDDNGFKSGGMYRGDDLKTMSNLQVYMYVDEANNTLVYNYIDQPIGHVISNMLYRVNNYGMLLSEELTNEEPNVKKSTIKIDIKYNEDAIYDINNFDIK